MGRFTVTECICHGSTFEEIKVYAKKYNIDSIEELQEGGVCSCGCQMCQPYVEMMLQTGITEFEPGAPHSRDKTT